MPKAQIITEDSVARLKQNILENIERLDAEIVVIEAETDQEKQHHRNERNLQGMSNRLCECYTQREVYHNCLCAIQRNITEIEI